MIKNHIKMQQKPESATLLLFFYVFLGIMANNPTLDVLTEIAEYNLALRSVDRADEVVEPEILLSLGTGVPPIRKVAYAITCI